MNLTITTVPLTASEAARLAFFLKSLEDPAQRHARIMARLNLDGECRTLAETDRRMQQIESADPGR